MSRLDLSGSSRDPTGETAAQSRVEQSVDVGGALLQLVDSTAAELGIGCGLAGEQKSRRTCLFAPAY